MEIFDSGVYLNNAQSICFGIDKCKGHIRDVCSVVWFGFDALVDKIETEFFVYWYI
jgi:hypothetical protein